MLSVAECQDWFDTAAEDADDGSEIPVYDDMYPSQIDAGTKISRKDYARASIILDRLKEFLPSQWRDGSDQAVYNITRCSEDLEFQRFLPGQSDRRKYSSSLAFVDTSIV